MSGNDRIVAVLASDWQNMTERVDSGIKSLEAIPAEDVAMMAAGLIAASDQEYVDVPLRQIRERSLRLMASNAELTTEQTAIVASALSFGLI